MTIRYDFGLTPHSDFMSLEFDKLKTIIFDTNGSDFIDRLKGYNISIKFDTLPNTIKLLGNELGHVIKQQAGTKYYKIVEEIRLNSKNYRQLKKRNI
ncbi:MAG: hypothetical protein Ct9H90mP17_4480 [Actinomycetota bacterium]|nr:MAG: hypothetical protein Ct9H90mP17_4480 [Actinomycetota bacterium]